MAERVLHALRPVRGPVRGLDIASKAHSPNDFTSLGGHASTHASAAPTTATATSMPPHEPAVPPKMDDEEEEDDEAEEATGSKDAKKKKRSRRKDKDKPTAEVARQKFPAPGGGDSPSGLGLRAEPPAEGVGKPVGETLAEEGETKDPEEDMTT
eukprot:s1946_g10.t1